MFGLSASAALLCQSLFLEQHVRPGILGRGLRYRIGQIRAVIIIYCAIIFAFILLVSVNQVWSFAVGVVTLGLCFGGAMGVFQGIGDG